MIDVQFNVTYLSDTRIFPRMAGNIPFKLVSKQGSREKEVELKRSPTKAKSGQIFRDLCTGARGFNGPYRTYRGYLLSSRHGSFMLKFRG
jgi:hypothetical protein